MSETQEKILDYGKLVKDANGEYYFYDDRRSGLYFKLTMLMRKVGEDEAGFNARIGKAGAALKIIDDATNAEVVYRPTIGLVPKQARALVSANWDAIFTSKTNFFLYDDSLTALKVGSVMPGYGKLYADFVWLNDNKVWTCWTPDGLAYRFPRTLTISGGTAATGNSNGDTTGEEITPTPISSGDFTMHIYCPHCGKVIF